jgi:hypothetical protein
MYFYEQANYIRGPWTNFTFSTRPLNSLLSILKTRLELEEWTNRNQEFSQRTNRKRLGPTRNLVDASPICSCCPPKWGEVTIIAVFAEWEWRLSQFDLLKKSWSSIVQCSFSFRLYRVTEFLANSYNMAKWNIVYAFCIQGGSVISGALSMFHRCI